MQATYDGLGRCVKRTVGVNTVLFTYDGWNPIMEWDTNGNCTAWTIYGAKPDEVLVRDDATYGALIYKHDNQGSVTFILDGSNRMVEKYSYDVYGRPTVTSWDYNTGTWKAPSGRSSFGNRFMFTGREWLADLQVYDYRHRLYNPDTARFMQSDPMGFDAGDMNLFRYCSNDPVNGTDPMGTETYFGYRDIGGAHPVPADRWVAKTNHQFVFTATNGNVIDTFGWGENPNPFRGVWTPGSADDRTAAAALLRDGGAMLVGDSSLDPFVSQAYAIVSREPPHVNGILDWGANTCQGEARHLVEVAQQLQTQFLESRLIDYDDDGSPVYSAPAVSGFKSDGSPIYDDGGGGGSPFGSLSYVGAQGGIINVGMLPGGGGRITQAMLDAH
jgi:RHS repeat-associated protein